MRGLRARLPSKPHLVWDDGLGATADCRLVRREALMNRLKTLLSISGFSNAKGALMQATRSLFSVHPGRRRI